MKKINVIYNGWGENWPLGQQGLCRILKQDLDPSQLGHSFEALVIGEIRAYNSYLKLNKTLFYYKYTGCYEIGHID